MAKPEMRNGAANKPPRRSAKRSQTAVNHAAPAPAPAAAPAPEAAGDGRASRGIRSYALLERDTMALYMSFYKHTYSKSTLDRKTKEFIAISAALATGCKNCLEGHLKKAIKHGATRAEISEVMAVTLGVAAATMVDRSDIAAANIQLDPETWTLADDD
jgi:AhpD family alkylhydroperoxidase